MTNEDAEKYLKLAAMIDTQLESIKKQDDRLQRNIDGLLKDIENADELLQYGNYGFALALESTSNVLLRIQSLATILKGLVYLLAMTVVTDQTLKDQLGKRLNELENQLDQMNAQWQKRQKTLDFVDRLRNYRPKTESEGA